MKRVLAILACWSFCAFSQQLDWVRQVKNKPETDLREFGAICDGRNINSAVQAALTAGRTRLYLPAGCKWVPTSNQIPGNIQIRGEDWATSKIWPNTPASNFLSLGPLTKLENVNLNGPGCHFISTGCPVKHYLNNNNTSSVPVQNYPYNEVFVDTGETAAADDPANTNDTNGVVVIQRGQGGGIYGQYNGGVGSSSGSGIHALNASDSGLSAGLRVTRTGTGPGTVLDGAAASGTDIQYTSGAKTSGNVLDFFHSGQTWSGNLINANLGYGTGGNFLGNFLSLNNNGTPAFVVDYAGRLTIGHTSQGALGTPNNGTMMYCDNCNAGSNPCTAGGTGAWAFRVAGAWKCPF